MPKKNRLPLVFGGNEMPASINGRLPNKLSPITRQNIDTRTRCPILMGCHDGHGINRGAICNCFGNEDARHI